MPGRYVVRITGKVPYGKACELFFATPDGFQPRPGQFVHVLCGGGGRILRRPYSVFSYAGGEASILVRETGSGSRWLMQRREGEALDILGPLGRGFQVPGEAGEESGRVLLLAGGAGIAPLNFLGLSLRERGWEVLVLWGIREGDEYGRLPEALSSRMGLRLATEDGSAGERGTVLGLMAGMSLEDFRAFYACGPRPMLAAVAQNLPASRLGDLQVSMEERMACGIGACRGCVVPAGDGVGYLTACRDGPVFGGKELDWERVSRRT